LERVGPTGDGLHVSGIIVEFGAAGEEHDAELFEERFEVGGLLDIGVETSNTKIPLSDSEAVPFSQVQVVENSERTTDMTRLVQPMKGILSPTASAPMKNIQEELEKALAPEIKNKIVDVHAKREGLVVSLREVGFYESGVATMRESSRAR